MKDLPDVYELRNSYVTRKEMKHWADRIRIKRAHLLLLGFSWLLSSHTWPGSMLIRK